VLSLEFLEALLLQAVRNSLSLQQLRELAWPFLLVAAFSPGLDSVLQGQSTPADQEVADELAAEERLAAEESVLLLHFRPALELIHLRLGMLTALVI